MKKQILFAIGLTLASFSVFSQNIGIGEPNPSNKLSVKGNFSVGENYSTTEAPVNGVIIEGTVGIGTANPSSEAILDLSGSKKGFVLPRVNTAERNAISNPPLGTLVYDTDEDAIYTYSNGWIKAIAGEQGTVGATGATGPVGPTGATGADGDRYSTTSSTSMSITSNASRTFTVETGLAYSIGQVVKVANTSSRFIVGTITSYNSSNGTMTITASSSSGSGTYNSWEVNLNGAVGGPAGPAGATGATGATGSIWLSGSSAPTGGQGSINDFYLRSSDGTYYRKTGASTWTSQGVLSGPTGATGATGPTGVTGVTGATGATGPTGAGTGYAATSSSSVAIGTGSKTFTTQANLAYLPGIRVKAVDANNTNNYMDGVVTSYSGNTLTVSVDATNGSGTINSWNLGVAGTLGAQGPMGPTGQLSVVSSNNTSTSTFNVAGTTNFSTTDLGSLTISESGNYLITLTGGFSGSNGNRFSIVLCKRTPPASNSTANQIDASILKSGINASGFTSISTQAYISVDEGDVISFRGGQTNGNNITGTNWIMTALKIN
ncbi:MAG: hypothetical protein KIS94_00370 [Chitinophagales bacterium]|nr:hypothetical protein [Chitinophagales bacterium]